MEPFPSKQSEAGHKYHHLPCTRYRGFRSARAQALSNAIRELHQVVHQATGDVAISHPQSYQSSQLQRWRSQSFVNHMMLAVYVGHIEHCLAHSSPAGLKLGCPTQQYPC